MISAELSRRLAQIWSRPEMAVIGEKNKEALRRIAEQKETFENLPKEFQRIIEQVEEAVRNRSK